MTSSTDLASPASDAVVRNPYRVLGLPGDATWAEVRAAAARLLEDPEPGRRTTPWDLPWLGPVPRGPADVERALAHLTDPNRRLFDRLFWIHERFAETAVHELTPATIRNAVEGWSSTSQPVALHDAAVVALIAALVLDPRIENSALWQRALSEWEDALELEAYWLEILRLEMEGGFETPASLAEVREIRERGLRLVSDPLLAHVREAVIADEPSRAARTLAVLRDILSEEAFAARCGELAEHVWGSLDADWSPEARTKSREPAESPPRSTTIDTQNPALWDFAAEDVETSVEATEPPEPAAGSGMPGAEPTGAPKPEAPEVDATAARPAPPTGGVDADHDASDRAPRAEPEPSRRETAPVASATPPTPEPDPPEPPEADRADTEDPRPDRPAGEPERARVVGARSLLAAAVAVLVVVTVAALAPHVRSSTDTGTSAAESAARRNVEERMETIDAALARALVDRIETDEEIGLLRESVEGYQTLVEDYERRMARRLPADREAYRRVAGFRDEARRRLDAVLADRRALEERIDRLERIASGLIAEWNAVGRSGTETERLPSP